jgi:hypothetical protein
LWEWEALEAEH